MAASAQGARTDPQGLPVSTGASWTRTHLTAACHHRTQAASCKFGVASLSVGDSEWGLGPGRGAPQWAASAIKPTQHRDAGPCLIDRRLACGLHQGLGAGIPVAGPGVPRAAAPAPAPRAAQAQAGARPARCTLGPPGPLRGMGDCGGRARAPADRPRRRAPGDTGPLQRLRMLANAA